MCYTEDQPSPTLDIWGVTSESEGVFLLRVSQSQIDAVRPAGRVAETADDYVKVCVREDRDVEVSMGPGPEGKTHHVTLEGGLLGPVRGTWDSYAAPSDVRDSVLEDGIVHIVQFGETLFAIANFYGVPMQDVIERNRLADGDVIYAGQKLDIRDASRQLPTASPQAPRPDGAVVHVVQFGETLFPIANTYGVSMQDIIERNRLADGDMIRPGQALIIRDGATSSSRQLPTVSPQTPGPDDAIVHVVRHGETLFPIANTYGVSMQDIIERNRLADGDMIRPGQALIIRDGATSSSRQLPTVSPQTPGPDGAIVHVVRHGETLFPIANTYGVPMQDIIERNRLADGDMIRPGQALIIRDAS